ncbi:DUF7010 family protein [Oceanobacillus chungangensis]|uniref:DUF308 domain-containing protein n=1 Tax=Oceanobacillus chungangensis TaxID=1229152 RepID=A0A3D8PG94_9BACI|nr:hypothetical protein [Oceanobacillus chungangensis]RDW15110.1 hypothetical protein CWR45_18245 [Oceanobacillus chungangensis]
MELLEMQYDLINKTRRGLPMIIIGVVFWFIVGLLSFFEMHIKLHGLLVFIGISIIFPLGILLSKIMKIDMVAKDNPLSALAGMLGAMQLFFTPLLMVIFVDEPQLLPFYVGILTGAHFFPFAWVYKSKAYIFQTVAIIAIATIFGFVLTEHLFTIFPFVMSGVYFVTSVWLTK